MPISFKNVLGLLVTKETWYIVGIFAIAIGGFFFFSTISDAVAGWFGPTKDEMKATIAKQAKDLETLAKANGDLKKDLATVQALHKIDLEALQTLRTQKETIKTEVRVIQKTRTVKVKEIDENPDFTVRDKAIQTAHVEWETLTNVYCTTNPDGCNGAIPLDHIQPEPIKAPAKTGFLLELQDERPHDTIHVAGLGRFLPDAADGLRDQDGVHHQNQMGSGGDSSGDAQDVSASLTPDEGEVHPLYAPDGRGGHLDSAFAERPAERVQPGSSG